jgi:nucleotide-binding universal stress UspA family protein
MYNIIMGIAPEDTQAQAKVEAVTDLPAAAGSVSVTIVHVTDDDTTTETELLSVPAVSDAHDYLVEHDVDVSLCAATGTPLNAILDTAEAEDADLICIAGRHRSPAGKIQLRSGSEAVILNTDRPVLIVGQKND